ncbi:MAG: MBL fold metallo-hydrolase [Cyanobacteria bacterium J06554_6]
MSNSVTSVDLPNTHTARVTQRSASFVVTFWGVRAHIPTPGLSTAYYGGNTACVEVQLGENRLIFDGGTGLRVLGESLLAAVDPLSGRSKNETANAIASISGHLFFTHARSDCIQGFPFFKPAFDPRNQFHVYGTSAANGASIKQCLTTQMLRPNSPVPFHQMAADFTFHDIFAGQVISLGNSRVETLMTNPQTGALGYRITRQDRSLVYAPDIDYAIMGSALARWTHCADLMICGSASMAYPLTRSDTSNYRPVHDWQTAIDLIQSTQIKQAIFSGFSPDQTDRSLNGFAQTLKPIKPRISLAREGLQIQLDTA